MNCARIAKKIQILPEKPKVPFLPAETEDG